jgi:hypothetical protein
MESMAAGQEKFPGIGSGNDGELSSIELPARNLLCQTFRSGQHPSENLFFASDCNIICCDTLISVFKFFCEDFNASGLDESQSTLFN